MASESLNRLAWTRLKENKLSFFAFCYIILAIFIGFFAVFISPDSSPNANEMHIELATKKPLTKVLFLEIPKDTESDITFFQSVFFGIPSKVKRVPINSFNMQENGLTYFPYDSEIPKNYIG